MTTESQSHNVPRETTDDFPSSQAEDNAAAACGTGYLVETLAELPAKAILDENQLATIFGVRPRTVRRMVSRFELPPPIKLAGRSVWLVGKVLTHIETAADKAAEEAVRRARRLRKHEA